VVGVTAIWSLCELGIIAAHLHTVSAPPPRRLGTIWLLSASPTTGDILHLGDDLVGVRGKRLTTSADPGVGDADTAGQGVCESKPFVETLDQSKNQRDRGHSA
jgi:hypothetical protein